MNSRSFLTGAVTAAASQPAWSQASAEIPTIGILVAQGEPAKAQWRIDAFRQSLARHGWIDGSSVRMAMGWGRGELEGNLAAARELVAVAPSVLVASNSQALVARRDVSGGMIPIVFCNVSDPVEAGYVQSIAQPGGMITGFTVAGAAIAEKWVEIIRELVPRVREIALIYQDLMTGWVPPFIQPFQQAARRLGRNPVLAPVREAGAYAEVIKRLAEREAVAIKMDDPLFLRSTQRAIDLAEAHRLPTIYAKAGFVITFGGLISCGINLVSSTPQSRATLTVS